MSLRAQSTPIPDRRQHPRVVTAFQAAFTTPDGETGEGTAIDLSTGGCKFHSLSPLILHAQIEIQIFVPGEHIPITVPMGLVRWAEGTTYGVEFLQLTEASRQLIQRLSGL
ncbi:MAG: PilZ domain-containing protein [Nitrospira sp.]|nr:PilZ domain-containing protein [Nitrospira sp.]